MPFDSRASLIMRAKICAKSANSIAAQLNGLTFLETSEAPALWALYNPASRIEVMIMSQLHMLMSSAPIEECLCSPCWNDQRQSASPA